MSGVCNCFFFFFQAEDGIRDLTVTGVQTCALPILEKFYDDFKVMADRLRQGARLLETMIATDPPLYDKAHEIRSEERRVGKSVDLGGRRIIKKKNARNKHTSQHSKQNPEQCHRTAR